MTDRKSEEYAQRSERATRDIAFNWPVWMRRNLNRPISQVSEEDDRRALMDAVQLVLDTARAYVPRGKGPHTPNGHDCEVCEAMRVVQEWLVTGELPPVDTT